MLAFSPDGKWMYGVTATGALVAVDLSGPTPVFANAGPTAPLMSMDIALDGAWIHAAPVVAPILPTAIDEDTTYNGSIAIGDDLTPVDNLNVLVTSSNQTLVPDAHILWGSNGGIRALRIAPAAGESGDVTIIVRVSDPNFYAETSFGLSVVAVNDAPTASSIAPQSTAEDTPTNPIALTVGDIDSPVADLIVTATSSDQAIVPNASIVAGGTGANRTLTITLAENAPGIVTITVRTSDGTDHVDTSFQLTVTSENDAPTLSSIANRTIEQDATTGPIAFTITDVDGFDGHIVTASSSNTTLVPNANANLTIGGAAGARTITVTPAAGQHGTATITVMLVGGLPAKKIAPLPRRGRGGWGRGRL